MTELLEDLDQRRSINNNEAEKHRKVRDELNEETKKWVQKRDELNSKVRELVDEAAKHREERDKLNEQVRANKEKRDVLNKRVNELFEKVQELRKQKAPKEAGPNIGRLRKELRQLENFHMTQALTREKEKEVMEQIKTLEKQIQEADKDTEADAGMKAAKKEHKDAKDDAEAQHRLVGDLAERAQSEHDVMIKLYEQADALRK
ncbi:MAG: phosphoserine phosphatase, partial [Methanomassiliicoccales archaeon]